MTGPFGATVTAVADGVHAYVQPDGSWWVNSTGVVVRDDDVVLVDACATAARTRALLDTVDRLAQGRPVRTVAVTHEHGDHAYGTALLPDAEVVASEACAAALAAALAPPDLPPIWEPMPDWGIDAVRVPDRTFAKDLVLGDGAGRVELHHPGYPAHTTGDAVAWLPEQGVLFTGDLVFSGVTPLAWFGSITGMLEALDWLASFGAAVLVPGHGTPTDAGVLAGQRRYYELVLDAARTGRARGLDPLQAARALSDRDFGEFDGWLDRERIVMNLHRAYAELDERLDVVPDAAAADAIAFNGGRRLHCTA